MTAAAPRTPRGPYAKSAARQAEIVEAAINVFAARGYHGGSLREIARELGMSLTAVTHHFPSKETLLEAVLRETDRQGGEVDRSVGLGEWILTVARRNLARPELVRTRAIVSAEASSPDHPAHAWFVERYATLREVMARTIAEDQELGRTARDVDPDAAAAAAIALWDGLQLQWLIDPGVDMITRLDEGLRTILPPPDRPIA